MSLAFVTFADVTLPCSSMQTLTVSFWLPSLPPLSVGISPETFCTALAAPTGVRTGLSGLTGGGGGGGGFTGTGSGSFTGSTPASGVTSGSFTIGLSFCETFVLGFLMSLVGLVSGLSGTGGS